MYVILLSQTLGNILVAKQPFLFFKTLKLVNKGDKFKPPGVEIFLTIL